MDVLKIIGEIILLCIAVGLFFYFDRQCKEQFQHVFIDKSSFITALIGGLLLFGGSAWREYAIKSHSDTLNGLIIAILGFLIICWMIFMNYKKTNLIYGTIGTSLQFFIFFIGGWVLLAFAVVFVMLWILPSFRLWWLTR